MEFFTHPWYMAAGGVLVSSPIIIHLINRMRFKRIRWAAMEFLLKSQKRNRRKLIIEQMILLLLRILLVLLAAFLVARFIYGAGTTRGASHVVIIDDTFSMGDVDPDGGKDITAFQTAIDQVRELAKYASEASSAQQMRIYLLSEINASPIFDERLSDRSVEKISGKFVGEQGKPSLLHVSPLVALQKGRQHLGDEKGEGQRVLHFISDFRDRDWSTGPEADKYLDEIKAILTAGINLNLVDAAAPRRPRGQAVKTVDAHNNLAIIDLKAETRVAIEDTDVEFTATLMNFGIAKTWADFQAYVGNDKILTSTVRIEDIEPGKIKEHKFSLRFTRRARPGSEITEKDTVEERERKRRLEREQFNVRATIGPEKAGINADNVRDLVIEVRKKVPTLVIDGNKPELRGEGSDMLHLQSFAAASGIYELEERKLSDLEKIDLELYPSIIMLNISELPAGAKEPDGLVKKLKSYVENGGSLCWFLGEEVRPEHYNGVLFKSGVFPLQIGDRPFDPIAADKVDPDDRKKERERLRQQDPQPKILFPKANHPLVARLVPFSFLFRFMSVNVYWQARPRSDWDPDGRKTESLIVRPNMATIDTYKNRALELTTAGEALAKALAAKEPEYKRYTNVMDGHRRAIVNALASGQIYQLGLALEKMLTDPGVDKDPEKPNMAELWKNTDMKALAQEIRDFRESVLYGDPLLVSRMQGKGRTVAFLTTAGTALRRGVGEDSVAWNNWGAGERAIQELYPLFLIDLQRYLISEGQAPNRLLGEEVRFTLDPARYAPNYTTTYIRQPDVTRADDNPEKIKERSEKGLLLKKDGQFEFALTGVRAPGFQRISLTLLGDGPEEDRQEVRSYAYNVDAVSEGDLKRASRDRMDPELPPGDAKSGKLKFRVAGDPWDEFKERQPDASESSLLYLFFILILVVEQAMAVHLSFHTRANEQAPAPSMAPAKAA